MRFESFDWTFATLVFLAETEADSNCPLVLAGNLVAAGPASGLDQHLMGV